MDTIFLIGAGINRAVQGPDSIFPPLSHDFFCQVLRHPRLAGDFKQGQLSPLLDYISKYWRLDLSQLETNNFDLEECYTFIELQRRESYFKGDSDGLAQMSHIQYLLTSLLLDYLSECEHWLLMLLLFRNLVV
jgi:hypothetical protein